MTGLAGLRIDDAGCEADDLAFCSAVKVIVPAAQAWDAFVALTVEREWVGLERLSGLAGTVGDVVACNAMAYGQAVSDTVAAVEAIDRADGRRRRFPASECGFDVGASRFMAERLPDGTARFALQEVEFLFRQGDLTTPIRDARLAGMLAIGTGERALSSTVRAMLLARAHAGE